MDHLLQTYNRLEYIDSDNDKSKAVLEETDKSIRSVLYFLEEESKVCSAAGYDSQPSSLPKQITTLQHTDKLLSAVTRLTSPISSNSDFMIMANPAKALSASQQPVNNGGFASTKVERIGPENSLPEVSDTDWSQAEYFCDDKSPYLTSVQPSPVSDIATPPTNIGQAHLTHNPSLLSLPASAMIQSPTSVSTDGSSLMQHHPQLYSAIGSLEDPTTNSLTRWNQAHIATKKYDFPSNTLLKPMNALKQRKKEPDGWSRAAAKRKNSVANASKTVDETSGARVTVAALTTPKKQSPSERANDRSDGAARKKPSNLKKSRQEADDPRSDANSKPKTVKHVTISEHDTSRRSRGKKKGGPLEMFRPSSDAYTPRMGKMEIKYKPAEMRTPVQTLATSLGTLQRPNFRDALRRVAMILHQHIVKIEHRFESKSAERNADNLFDEGMREVFSEERFASSRYKCTMVRVPMARGGMVYGLKQIRRNFEIPSEGEIYEFAHQLFNSVQLSSECSIVCLIYVERLMEASKVPLLASTWRPIFMCGLLLASKVWQDLSSWNIEFASVYPQFSLDAINRLEILFLRMIKWDLYISSSCYAKYYFALRSLVEKPDFRQRYNRMVGLANVEASEALKIERRSTLVKEEAISQLSRSM